MTLLRSAFVLLVLGVLAIQGTHKTTATLSIAVPALVMTIPMLDTLLAIVRRWLTGRRFDVADRGYFCVEKITENIRGNEKIVFLVK